MFQALLAHPQEVLNKGHMVYCVPIISVGYATIALQTWHSQLTLYALNIPSAMHNPAMHGTNIKIPSVVCRASPEDEQVMLETCIGS
jgi:hypothetical protein